MVLARVCPIFPCTPSWTKPGAKTAPRRAGDSVHAQGVDNGDETGVAELAHAVQPQAGQLSRALCWTKPPWPCIADGQAAGDAAQVLEHLRVADKALAGKKVLIVDDDIAISSRSQPAGMAQHEDLLGETGRRAIKILQNERAWTLCSWTS